ncbi:MAG: hypothetical protein H7Y11_13395 [Armatimonadetes bacterium]|nr:hypothetical protein [Anaerolineae bacterium]
MTNLSVELSIEQLTALIDQRVDQKLQAIASMNEIHYVPLRSDSGQNDPRTLAELQTWVEQNRWTPPPGTPSVVELLREDRDR